jgi:hypothetical protein
VEVEDLIAGLRPELDAANSTWQHMLRIQKALEARQAEAVRRMQEMTGYIPVDETQSATAAMSASAEVVERANEVEAELEALKREMNS